jgi:hypothetical protein
VPSAGTCGAGEQHPDPLEHEHVGDVQRHALRRARPGDPGPHLLVGQPDVYRHRKPTTLTASAGPPTMSGTSLGRSSSTSPRSLGFASHLVWPVASGRCDPAGAGDSRSCGFSSGESCPHVVPTVGGRRADPCPRPAGGDGTLARPGPESCPVGRGLLPTPRSECLGGGSGACPAECGTAGRQARRPLPDRDAEGRRWPGSTVGRTTAWVCRRLTAPGGAHAGRS